MALMLGTACDRASGDRSSSSEPVFPDSEGELQPGASSLDDRPQVVLGFMQPVGTLVTTKAHQPLLDYLTAQTPYRFRVLFSTDSERAVGTLEERLVEISRLGPVSYLEAHVQFGAVPLVKSLNREGELVSRGVFLVRRGSPIERLGDLRGHSLALGAFHSTLSHLLPRYELTRAGVSVEELDNVELFDDDDAVVSAVLDGRFDAGAVEDVVADRHGDEELRVLHVSEPVPSAPLVIRDDLPQRVSGAIRDALLKLDFEGAEDREDWHESIRYGFAPATHADYDSLREMTTTLSRSCAEGCHSGVEFGANFSSEPR